MSDFSKGIIIPKRQRLVQQLRQEILSGVYTFGEKLPPIAKLAEHLDGNYVTVIKVLHDLEQEGYVQCRNGVGCFVKYLPADKPALHKRVQLIVERGSYESGEEDVLSVIDLAREQFTAKGWEYEVCLVSLTAHELQRAINNPDAYSVVYGILPYLDKSDANFAYVHNRLVLIGEFANQYGIATVISDEYLMIRLAIEHLRSQGYENTGIILCSNRSHVETIFAEAWVGVSMHYGKSLQWCNEHCIFLEFNSLDDYRSTDFSKKRLLESRLEKYREAGYLADTDSFIGPGGYWLKMVCDYLKKQGYRIPEDFGIISIGDNQDAQTYDPPLSILNPHLEEHVAFAVEILENRFRGNREIAVQYCGTPTLTVRDSTRRCKPARKSSPKTKL